jgi:hypothetical protein
MPEMTLKIRGALTTQIRINLLWDICITEEEPCEVKSSGPVKNKLAAQMLNILGGMQM